MFSLNLTSNLNSSSLSPLVVAQATALLAAIRQERVHNDQFSHAVDQCLAICNANNNLQLTTAVLEEMLVQYLLTREAFLAIFHNQEFISQFLRHNPLAAALETVITTLDLTTWWAKGGFSVKSSAVSHKSLPPCDKPNFKNASCLNKLPVDWSLNTPLLFNDAPVQFVAKQQALNQVYERFFQVCAPKAADTNGIVYTPPSIVDFIVASVVAVLQREFGRDLGSPGVHIGDPFVGTGNFLGRVMQQVPLADLPRKYRHELHGQELMLLPYYLALANLEHEYFQLTGHYQPFKGLRLTDTFSSVFPPLSTLAPPSPEQAAANPPIWVILGNPPYNVGQTRENDNNKNRYHPLLDQQIRQTYARASQAINKNALFDVYVKAIRWASNCLANQPTGIVAFITNNSFVHNVAFDGLRHCLTQDFDQIYILDLGGNVRHNPKLSGSKHNVFGIKIGVSINIFIKNRQPSAASTTATIYYHRLEEFWLKEQKYQQLAEYRNIYNVPWQTLPSNESKWWITAGLQPEFDEFLALAARASPTATAICQCHSRGLETAKDAWLYNFSVSDLTLKVQQLIDVYHQEASRWRANPDKSLSLDNFVLTDDTQIKWSSKLKAGLASKNCCFNPNQIRRSLYRPFTAQYVYFDPVLVHRCGQMFAIFPTVQAEQENLVICVSGVGSYKPFQALMTNQIPCLDLLEKTQCFPFYHYDLTSGQRRENISNEILVAYRHYYQNPTITKWEIFYYIYAVLHHPLYRERYAANLRRQLPRIPYWRNFAALTAIGRQLAHCHVNYGKLNGYHLEKISNPQQELDWTVNKIQLTPDRRSIIYNESLTLRGIPTATFDYQLGHRSALEAVLAQHQVTRDPRSQIVKNPNRPDDPQYLVRLIEQVIAVSLTTVGLVQTLSTLEPLTS